MNDKVEYPGKDNWKDLPGSSAQISRQGDVRIRSKRLPGGWQLKTFCYDANGLKLVSLKVDGIWQSLSVARLVGRLFCPDFKPELRTLYRNGIRDDCRATNLLWVEKARVCKAPQGGFKKTDKLTSEIVREIREARDCSLRELAARYGVSPSSVGDVRNRKSWKHVE